MKRWWPNEPPRHWIRWTATPGAAKPSRTLACGVALTQAQWVRRAFENVNAVTCPKCLAVAKREQRSVYLGNGGGS